MFMFIGVAFITHITHMRSMRKNNIYSKVTLKQIFCFLTIGATLKGKNLLPLGANCSLWEQILSFKSSSYFRRDSRHIFFFKIFLSVLKIIPFWLRHWVRNYMNIFLRTFRNIFKKQMNMSRTLAKISIYLFQSEGNKTFWTCSRTLHELLFKFLKYCQEFLKMLQHIFFRICSCMRLCSH